jgi:hypothetical protein
MIRRPAVLLWLLVSTACARDTLAPPNTVLGRFGGRATELVATTESVRVQFVCGVAVFRQPLVPGDDGHFVLSPMLISTRFGTAALAIKGVVSSNQIAFDAVSLSAAGDVTTSRHVVMLNEAADYSGLACSADGED